MTIEEREYYWEDDDDFGEGFDAGHDPLDDRIPIRTKSGRWLRTRRGPKGKRKQIIKCNEFEQLVIPLYNLRNEPKAIIDNIIEEAIVKDQISINIKNTDHTEVITNYIKRFFIKNKKIAAINKQFKKEPYTLDLNSDHPKLLVLLTNLGKFAEFEVEIEKLKAKYVWECWFEIEERCKKITQNIIYTKSLVKEEAENLLQDTALYYHHLHMVYDPFFIKGKTMPYVFYMLNMVRQKLRYHVQAFHIKRNKEDLKDEISDFDMTANYINAQTTHSGEDFDYKAILSPVEKMLPSDKIRLIFDMLKDGYQQKNISKEIGFTQSWVSINKKKIKLSIIKIAKETGQGNLLEQYGINVDDYSDTDLENIWDK